MGQCSTLPTEGRSAASTKGENVPHQYEESSQSRNEHFEQMMNDIGHLQERNPEVNRGESDQMEEDNPRDGIPQPPDVATRTRCYKLNLDAEINPQSHAYLGPFTDVPPPLTFSTSDDSSAKMNQTQIAIRTAKIFRGIKISTDGTILSQNARASRSNKGSKNKKGEKSRQASKIEKANDLVEESMLTGKVSAEKSVFFCFVLCMFGSNLSVFVPVFRRHLTQMIQQIWSHLSLWVNMTT